MKTEKELLALEALQKRKELNATIPKIDNSQLPAGSPMYFYCYTCGGLSDVLPEDYACMPKHQCDKCQELIDLKII